MRRFFPAVFAVGCPLLLAAAPLPAPVGPPTPAELADGQALAEHIRSAVPKEDSEFHGNLIIRANGAQHEVPVTCKVTVGPTNWTADYEIGATDQSGAEHLVIVHGPDGSNEYRYARAAAPSAPLPDLGSVSGQGLAAPLAGSDFSLGDLGLDFLHWPAQRELKGEMRLGEPCYVLESSNSMAGEIVRVKSDIDKEFLSPLIADGYDADGHLVKEFSLHGSSFKKVDGRWQVEKMDIRNKKTGSRTELKFDLNK
jgi:hypothetical protein